MVTEDWKRGLRGQVAEWNRTFHWMGIERRVIKVVFNRVSGEILEVVSERHDYESTL